MLIHQMLMLRSTRGLRSSTHSEEQGSSGEPSIIHHDTSKWAVTPKTFPFPLVIYFSNLKKIGVRSDVCNMIVIFIGLVIPIPNSCSLSLFFFLNLFYRAASHRLNLVKVLSDGGFHVLSVDYRGFGDSTGKPTEEGLTADAICVYEWTKARSGTTPVCLWGHSLGTGVVTNAAKVLEEKGSPVDAIVLECPFTNLWVASINYPLLKIYRKLPGCLCTLMDALRKDKIVFPNDENVKFLSSPLLILHGEDDLTVPLEFGKKLYEIAYNAYRNKERVKMVIFPPGFQHNLLCKHPTLLKTVRDFLSQQWG
uniref:Abhydrolase domain containing 12B n=1 Tax=Rousettus aegyptiacus TaxID=9407 RepID=A0A7J8IF80_ROUAE|nr:abhydrolase domain containing 12B [Rousettus aegyptiacus]